MYDGLLLIDKQTGSTSHDAVQRVRRILGQRKVGHCGTLDPSATGLLLLTLGQATRLTRFLIRAPKVYDGTIHFGQATDTYDAAGKVTEEKPTDGLTAAALAEAMARFEGELEHAAPPYSATKVEGKKLYELARQGEEVPVKVKQVTVYEFRPTTELDNDAVAFRLACTSGTYARTLVHDVGQELGTGAHLSSLRRLKIGPFELTDAITLDALAERVAEAAGEDGAERPENLSELLDGSWVNFDQIPLPFGDVTADAQQEQRIQHGQTVLVRELEGDEGDWVKLVNRRQEMIAVGTVTERIGRHGVGIVQPRVVFK